VEKGGREAERVKQGGKAKKRRAGKDEEGRQKVQDRLHTLAAGTGRTHSPCGDGTTSICTHSPYKLSKYALTVSTEVRHDSIYITIENLILFTYYDEYIYVDFSFARVHVVFMREVLEWRAPKKSPEQVLEHTEDRLGDGGSRPEDG
jgi:hypothetical protein